MDVAELKEKINIVEYIEQYVPLEGQSGVLFGLCPFHEEDTPSFAVHADEQYFYCFGCGAGGDVIAFAQKYHKVGMRRAVKLLCDYAGIDDDLSEPKEPKLSALRIMRQYVNKQKRTQKKAEQIPSYYMDQFTFDKDGLKSWFDEGIREQEMQKHGIRFDKLSNRIVIPIYDPFGKLINVAGRTIDSCYKEKKLRKYSYYFSVGSINTIYGLYENRAAAQERGEVIVFEGAKSVMKAESYGYPNSVAILTSHLSSSQLSYLVTLRVPVTFALDSDIDPRQDKNIMKLKRYTKCYWVRNFDDLLEPKMAPVDAGKDTWEKLYNNKVQL